MTLSNTAKSAVFKPETDEVFVILITISGDTLDETIRVCTDPKELLPIAGVRGVVSNGNEYIYLPMQIELPHQDDTGIAKARITIDNIDRSLVEGVRGASESLDITLQVVLASDPDYIEMESPGFKLKGVKYDSLTISGDLTVEYYDQEPFPSGRFTPSKFAGLF